MGAYTKERIEQDFIISAKVVSAEAVAPLVCYAKAILEIFPDNAARDMSISHLLEAAAMMAASFVMGAGKP